jgi:hypothetical protein
MKRFILFCLLIAQNPAWSQNEGDTTRFVIRTYGFASWDDYDQLEDSIAVNHWDITYLPVAGCVVTDDFVDSIGKLNESTFSRLKIHYGSDWKKRFDDEVDAAYQILQYQKASTFRETASCTTEQYSFKVLENLSQTELKFSVIPQKAKNQNNHDIRLVGLQHVDPTILYRGYDNLISLEFDSLSGPISVSIKSNGELHLADSCPASNKIRLGYRASGSIKSDTLLVETNTGKVQQYIFNLKNLSSPCIYFNEEFLDSTLSISKLKPESVLSMHYDKSCRIPDRFTVLSWEIWCSEKKPLVGGGNIIPMSIIGKLKTLNPGTRCSILVTVSTPGGILRKKIVDFTLTN